MSYASLYSMRYLTPLLIIGLTSCAPSVTPSTSQPTTSIGGSQTSTTLDPQHEVLILGDSIALGYAPAVATLLAPLNYKIDVADNTRNSYYLNQNLPTYLASHPNADIITFNAGAWDTIINSVYFLAVPDASTEAQNYNTTDAEYQANILSIAQQLLATQKRVIFFLTTDCLPNDQEDVTRITTLNSIASQVLPPLGIQVVDLHTLSLSLKNHHEGSNHYDAAGNALLAGLIASTLLTN